MNIIYKNASLENRDILDFVNNPLLAKRFKVISLYPDIIIQNKRHIGENYMLFNVKINVESERIVLKIYPLSIYIIFAVTYACFVGFIAIFYADMRGILIIMSGMLGGYFVYTIHRKAVVSMVKYLVKDFFSKPEHAGKILLD